MSAIGKIGFLGGGNMAKALAKGFLAAGEKATNKIDLLSDILCARQ